MDRMRHGREGSARALRRVAVGAAALALLGGCEAVRPALTTPADSYPLAGGIFGPAWGGNAPEEVLAASATIARLRDAPPPAAVDDLLIPEPGDSVWPGPLPPRSTLANPDAALRDIPEFRSPDIRSDPRPRTPLLDPLPTRAPGPPRGLPDQVNPPSSLLPEPRRAPPTAVLPPPPPLPDAPPPRADGRVIMTPSGPVVTSGGTDRVQGYVGPDGRVGTVIQQGGTTTVIPSGGAPQSGVPVR